MGQEFDSSLAVGFWLKISNEGAVKKFRGTVLAPTVTLSRA